MKTRWLTIIWMHHLLLSAAQLVLCFHSFFQFFIICQCPLAPFILSLTLALAFFLSICQTSGMDDGESCVA